MNPHQSAEMVHTTQQSGTVFIRPSRLCGGLWSSFLIMDSPMIGSPSKSLQAGLLKLCAGLAGSRTGIWGAAGISIVIVSWFILLTLSGRVNLNASRIVTLTNFNLDSMAVLAMIVEIKSLLIWSFILVVGALLNYYTRKYGSPK